MNCSIFNKATSTIPSMSVDFFDIMNAIKDESFADVVKGYRETKQRSEKILIPCFTPCGMFSERNIEGLAVYNPIVCIDIDKKDNMEIDLDSVFERLTGNKFVAAIHRSVGGEGLAVYIIVENEKEALHGEIYKLIAEMFKKSMSVNVDMACTDISRLRFVSSDKDCYINKNSQVLSVEIPASVKRTVQRYANSDDKKFAHQAIQLIVENEADITEDYDDWLRVCFCIVGLFGEEGRAYFHEISALSSKYKERECDRLYSRALNKPDITVTKDTLFFLMKKHGIYHSKRLRNE